VTKSADFHRNRNAVRRASTTMIAIDPSSGRIERLAMARTGAPATSASIALP
jgi:hypothetical protein